MAVSLAPTERRGPGVLAAEFEKRGVAVRHVGKRPRLDPTLPARLGRDCSPGEICVIEKGIDLGRYRRHRPSS